MRGSLAEQKGINVRTAAEEKAVQAFETGTEKGSVHIFVKGNQKTAARQSLQQPECKEGW